MWSFYWFIDCPSCSPSLAATFCQPPNSLSTLDFSLLDYRLESRGLLSQFRNRTVQRPFEALWEKLPPVKGLNNIPGLLAHTASNTEDCYCMQRIYNRVPVKMFLWVYTNAYIEIWTRSSWYGILIDPRWPVPGNYDSPCYWFPRSEHFQPSSLPLSLIL